MEIVLDVQADAAFLRDPDDMKRFNVRVLGADDQTGAELTATTLRHHNIGGWRPDGEVLIEPAAVRRLATKAFGGNPPASWESGFEAMMDYAGAKGWIVDGGAIRAHVEWGDE